MFPRSLRLPRRKHARGTPSAKARVRAPGGIHRHTVAVGGLRRWLELAHARPAARPPSAIRFAGVIGGVKAHRHDERRFQADDLGSVAYFRQLRATSFFSDQRGCGTSSKCGRRSVESQYSRKFGPGSLQYLAVQVERSCSTIRRLLRISGPTATVGLRSGTV